MSIKRAKQRTFGSDKDSSGQDDYFAKPKEPEKTWEQQIEGKGDDAFTPYAMSTHFAKGTLIHHAKFGKGIVTHVEGTHVEVLFETGQKKLGHGAS